MDIESVREQMGHKDVESISRYLAPHKGKAMQKKLDDVWKEARCQNRSDRDQGRENHGGGGVRGVAANMWGRQESLRPGGNLPGEILSASYRQTDRLAFLVRIHFEFHVDGNLRRHLSLKIHWCPIFLSEADFLFLLHHFVFLAM
jgi:hypothetical protein